MVAYPALKEFSMVAGEDDWNQIYRLLLKVASKHNEIPGVCMDFGTGTGGTAMLLASLFPDREVHSIDTFSGLMPASPEDGDHHAGVGAMRCSLAEVQERIDRMGFGGQIFLHQGSIEQWCERHEIEHVAAAVVDANVFSPTNVAIQWLSEPGRMSKGGVIIFDDLPYQGVAKAIKQNNLRLEEFGRIGWKFV